MNDIENLPQITYKGSFTKFPENPEPYDVILKDSKIYLFKDNWEEVTDPEWNFIDELYKILKEAENCKLKTDIQELLEEYQERNRLYNGIPTAENTF